MGQENKSVRISSSYHSVIEKRSNATLIE